MNREPAKLRPKRVAPGSADSGIATLTMVMVLFFVMAMVAAYTNRNLLYEQRMSINNFRATAAVSAADAGIDWTIAMLSGARVDSNCAAPVAPAAGDIDFRSRYTILKDDGTYTFPKWGGGTGTLFSPICVLGNAGWNCKCPDLATPLPAIAVPANSAPMFAVEVSGGGAPGVLTVDVRGSHEASREAAFGSFGNYNRVQVKLALVRALPNPPVAALTVGGTVDMTAAGLKLAVANTDPTTGVTVHSGGALTANAVGALLETGPAGSGSTLVASADGTLANLAAVPVVVPTPKASEDPPAAVGVFQSVFGMDAATHARQPSAVFIDCTAGCTSADISTPVANNPGRIIWVDGDLTLDSAATLGSAGQPLMLIATRDLTLAAAVTLNGFVYSGRNVSWTAAAAGSVAQGALVAGGNFTGASDVTVAYDADMLKKISLSYGSFVRIPGSWQVIPLK